MHGEIRHHRVDGMMRGIAIGVQASLELLQYPVGCGPNNAPSVLARLRDQMAGVKPNYLMCDCLSCVHATRTC